MKRTLLLLMTILLLTPSLASSEAQSHGATRLKTVVIDPGHGGIDFGAVGPTGVMEKDVNLATALKLARLLSAKPDLEVILTRDEDKFIPLTERTAIANNSGADIFVSIHTNASLGKAASGIETYFLSFDATDDDARRVAAFENGVVKYEESPDGGKGAGARDNLQLILWDMTKTEFLNESSLMAEIVQEGLRTVSPDKARGVKQAPFIVLMGTAMPAILVEVGFITNPEEEKRLVLPAVQEDIALSIFKSINKFEKLVASKWGI
ncbi:MAG: N-acetylmuramoyl-L-alanine amidase [Thermodesulfobacteriota bacterium]